ncbi:MAG: RadC family protein [Christensenellales bacterium]
MPNEHSGHRSRIRDRVRKEGLDSFQNYQVLEYALSFVIPYKDTNPLAHRLINKFGSLAGVLEANEEDLATVSGMGEVSAHFLANLINIFHYYEKDKVTSVATLTNPDETFNYIKPFLKGKLIEEMYLVCLTPNNKIVSVEKVAEGTANEAHIPVRVISDKMSRARVSNIVIAHNHPKGLIIPSDDDNRFTKALVTSLSINGCHLLDHIIIGDSDNEYYSYRKSGLIDKYREDAYMAFVLDKKVSQPMAKYEVDYDKK